MGSLDERIGLEEVLRIFTNEHNCNTVLFRLNSCTHTRVFWSVFIYDRAVFRKVLELNNILREGFSLVLVLDHRSK
jgi:hypothetical protein